MTDLQETPATPAEPHGGDERIGYFAAGGTLVFLGWGLGVVVNWLLHYVARSGAFSLWGVHFGATVGPYAWGVFGFGVVAGAVGVVLIAVGRATPRGPFVLPGAPY